MLVVILVAIGMIVFLCDGAVSEVEVDVITEFVDTVHFANSTPVNEATLCTNWPNNIVCGDDRVIVLNFTSMSLNGALPASLSRLTMLRELIVTNNSLTGSIPDSFVDLTNLVTLQVDVNNMSGTLPTLSSSNKKLEILIVSSNRFFGTLPSGYSDLPSLRVLSLDGNNLSGTLPPVFSRWGSNFTTVQLGSNAFSGTLPSAYANWTSIVDFVISDNQFSGSLPAEFSKWGPSLLTFNIRNNNFVGQLPPAYALWVALRLFEVNNNGFTGTLPSSYSAWVNVTRVFVSSNHLTGIVPFSWGSLMSNLATLSVFNNSLSGSLPSQGYSTLALLAASNNQFSGGIPTWTSTVFIDAQNNSGLSGSFSSSRLLLATTCGTDVCTSGSESLVTTLCFPPGLVGAYADSGVVLGDIPLLIQQLAPYVVTLPLCSSFTTIAPGADLTNNGTINTSTSLIGLSVSVSQKSTSAISAAAAIVPAALGGIDAFDAQMLVSVLSSPCTCAGDTSEASSTSNNSEDSSIILHIALSPFSPLGATWMVIGNVVLCCSAVLSHCLLAGLCDHRLQRARNSRHNSNQRLDTLGRGGAGWFAQWLEGGRWRRLLLMRLRFPNASVTLILFLIPGVVNSVCAVVIDMTSDNTSTSSTTGASAAAAAAVVIGIAFLASVAVCTEFLLSRHIEHEIGVVASSRGRPVASRGENQIHHAINYQQHVAIEALFCPVPRRVARVVLPRGIWMPDSARRAYGGLVSSYTGEWRRVWRVPLLINVVVQILSSIGGGGGGRRSSTACDVTQGLTILVLISSGTFFLAVKPLRAVLASYLTCVALLLNVVVTILAMMCRLGSSSVDQSAVDSFGTFASVMMLVMKAYHVGLPYVEGWLMTKNALLHGEEDQLQRMLLDPKDDRAATHKKKTMQQQLALKELLELISSSRRQGCD